MVGDKRCGKEGEGGEGLHFFNVFYFILLLPN